MLSGTSVDGIDVILLNISGSGMNTVVKVIDFETYKYPEDLKELILKNSVEQSSSVADISRLNVILGKIFAESALKICYKNKIKPEKVSFIGSHGQTIHHLPDGKQVAGYSLKSTFQIGDPSIIANLTGITTVGDFRIADCAFGGDGAPLVPYFDFIMFRSKKLNRALINIGGIANITVIPKKASRNEIVAFDTGPGNMLIDGMTKKLFNVEMDKDGELAAGGKINKDLFDFLKTDPYIKMKPPKSTGRELYGENYQQHLLSEFKQADKNDIIRTVTEYTAYSIFFNYNKFISSKNKLDEIIISGGGARNPMLVKILKKYFDGTEIKQFESYGIDIDSKEAALFAILANECLLGNPANMPSVTGSSGDVILGKICLSNHKANVRK